MEKMVEMESVALHWFRKLDLLSSFFPMRLSRGWEGRQPAAPWMVISFAWFVFPYAWTYHTNCSFSIYDLFAFCRSFAQSFEIGRESTNVRALECEMRSMCTHPSGMKTTYHFFPPLVVVGFVFVFHLCTEPPKHSVLYARNKSYMKRCAVVENW